MKKGLKLFLMLTLVLGIFLTTGCGKKKDLSAAAGTYKGEYIKFVGDDTKDDSDKFELVLNADGTGKHNRNNASYNVTWDLDGETFTMKEKFIGDPIEYTGTLKDGKLDIYNGDPKNNFTAEYVYSKK